MPDPLDFLKVYDYPTPSRHCGKTTKRFEFDVEHVNVVGYMCQVCGQRWIEEVIDTQEKKGKRAKG